jgi:uncharacterized protein (TIGR03083 family)
MSRLSRAAVLAAYRDGITVICELAAQFSEVAWLAPTPCREWRAVDLAGHLRCVADDYHEYLDDAPASRLARLMATGAPAESLARKLARQNAAELAALPDGPGPEHIAAFAESARAYGRRVYSTWDQPHHSYHGSVVTVGGMARAACAEWHVHAWDLARSLGKDYRPADPGLVLTAWQTGTPELWGVASVEVAGDDQWNALLGASGRDPGWARMLLSVT